MLYVLLAIRESPWCWPFGIASAALFLVVFADARIYGAASLQAVYVVVSVYGWRQWLRGGAGHGRLVVSRTPRPWLVGLLAAGALGTLVLFVLLRHRTDAALPLPDAATTAFSLAAQWMATRKWLESWVLWIAVDAVYVGMYASQRLYPTAGLYAAFLVLAVLGWREWRHSMAAAASS